MVGKDKKSRLTAQEILEDFYQKSLDQITPQPDEEGEIEWGPDVGMEVIEDAFV